MPIEIIKYLCQFKCGTKARSTISQIRLHEKLCFLNPERKACTTCKHERYVKDGTDHPELPGCPSEHWMERGCNILDMKKFNELWNSCEYHSKPIFNIQPVVNCPFWELS